LSRPAGGGRVGHPPIPTPVFTDTPSNGHTLLLLLKPSLFFHSHGHTRPPAARAEGAHMAKGKRVGRLWTEGVDDMNRATSNFQLGILVIRLLFLPPRPLSDPNSSPRLVSSASPIVIHSPYKQSALPGPPSTLLVLVFVYTPPSKTSSKPRSRPTLSGLALLQIHCRMAVDIWVCQVLPMMMRIMAQGGLVWYVTHVSFASFDSRPPLFTLPCMYVCAFVPLLVKDPCSVLESCSRLRYPQV
jgi:hypothetical protein